MLCLFGLFFLLQLIHDRVHPRTPVIAMQCRVKRHNAARHASKHIACWRRRIRETVRRLWWRVRQRFEWIDKGQSFLIQYFGGHLPCLLHLIAKLRPKLGYALLQRPCLLGHDAFRV